METNLDTRYSGPEIIAHTCDIIMQEWNLRSIGQQLCIWQESHIDHSIIVSGYSYSTLEPLVKIVVSLQIK